MMTYSRFLILFIIHISFIVFSKSLAVTTVSLIKTIKADSSQQMINGSQAVMAIIMSLAAYVKKEAKIKILNKKCDKADHKKNGSIC